MRLRIKRMTKAEAVMRLDEDDDQAEAVMRLRIRSMTKLRLS